MSRLTLPRQKPVELSEATIKMLMELPDSDRGVRWTAEMDAMVLKGRELGKTWESLGTVLGCSETSVRRRYRKLTRG